MTEILEIFFSLSVWFPLAVIGLLGLIGAFVGGALSTVLLASKGAFFEAIPTLLMLLIVIGVGFSIIPNGQYVGPPAAIAASFLTFRAHAKRSVDGHQDTLDRLLMFGAAVATIAMAVPFVLLVFNMVAK